MSSYIPAELLPKWLLLIAGAAVFNSVQNLTSIKLTQRIYSNQPQQVTGLSSRTFSVWTLLSGIIRIYAAYDIYNPTLYTITLWTFGLAWIHFASEWTIYKTAGVGPGLLSPVFVSTISLIWMIMQKEYYMGK